MILTLAVIISYAVIGGFVAPAFAGPQQIGPEALVDLPESALWNGIVNFRPGDGEVVNRNPPRFSWSYTPKPADADEDTSVKEFQFQVSNDRSFKNPIVNVRTQSNLYNTLRPFEFKTVYWRVGYIEEGQQTAKLWSEIRSLRIADDAISWDRSMLADESYLAQRGVHPHILFNPQNRKQVYDYIRRTDPKAWQKALRMADADINAGWWGEENPQQVKDGRRAFAIENVAFVWQMTRDQKYLAAKPQEALLRLIRHYLSIQGERKDVITQLPGGGGEIIRALGFGYDWLYEVMTTEQREEVRRAIEANCKFIMNAFWWRFPREYGMRKSDPLAGYPGGFTVLRQSAAKIGTSHQINNFQHALVAALAAFPESKKVREFFNLGVNYMIGRTYPYGSDGGMNQGRPYSATEGIYEKTVLNTAMLYNIAFPEAQFDLNPFFKLQADWWDRIAPVGFVQGHEPWGDTGWGAFDRWRLNTFGRDLALFTGDGRALKHWREENAVRRGGPPTDNFEELPLPFYFKQPREEETAPLSKAFLEEGWVIGATYPSNTKACFADGVGFVFQARPRGSECGHSHFSDLSFQLWAYGSTITDAGAMMTSYAKVAACHYSLLVDGLGTCQPLQGPIRPFYSRIIAFKETPAYTYAAADATDAYPRTDFQAAGWLLPREFATRHSGAPLRYVKHVRRHLLFVRKKYFVIFDELETEKPAKFTWLYHVLENTLKLDTNKTSFDYTSGAVPVRVAHIARPEALEVIDLTGEKARSNPFTNEVYDARRDPHPRSHALWMSNKTPATKFHFMTVIYPAKPGMRLPTITRIDDYTAAVSNGDERDVITFDPQAEKTATIAVDLQAIDSRS